MSPTTKFKADSYTFRQFADAFRKFSHHVAQKLGTPWSFLGALVIVLVWAISGPVFHYSDTWQLVINTGTTIITFLMVFLIQNTQNRDAQAIHLKLDELIYAAKRARNTLVDIEDTTDEEIQKLSKEFKKLRVSKDRSASQKPRRNIPRKKTQQKVSWL